MNMLQAIKSSAAGYYLRYIAPLKPYTTWLSLAGIVLLVAAALVWQTMSSKPQGKVAGVSIQAVPVASSSASVASAVAVKTDSQILKVDISGAVNQPGVKELKQGDRVEDAVKAAGGFTDQADANYVAMSINLAAKLQDGDKIFIPVKGQSLDTSSSASSSTSSTSSTSTSVSKSTSTSVSGGKVSINHGTAAQLNSLPGIGDTYSQRIIAGRPYSSVDDLCSRSDIFRSKTTCDKIRSLVTL